MICWMGKWQGKGDEKVLWRFLICLLLRQQKESYRRAVRVGKDIYIIDFHKYIPVDEEIQRWKDAIGQPKASDQKNLIQLF